MTPASSAAFQLDPSPFTTYLACWLGLTAFQCLIGVCVRRSGWWRPADEYAHNPSTVVFGIGLLLLCALASGVLWILNGAGRRIALGTTIIILAFSISIVLGHLAFLDAYALRSPQVVSTTPGFTAEEIDKIFQARQNLLDSLTCRRTSCSGLG